MKHINRTDAGTKLKLGDGIIVTLESGSAERWEVTCHGMAVGAKYYI